MRSTTASSSARRFSSSPEPRPSAPIFHLRVRNSLRDRFTFAITDLTSQRIVRTKTRPNEISSPRASFPRVSGRADKTLSQGTHHYRVSGERRFFVTERKLNPRPPVVEYAHDSFCSLKREPQRSESAGRRRAPRSGAPGVSPGRTLFGGRPGEAEGAPRNAWARREPHPHPTPPPMAKRLFFQSLLTRTPSHLFLSPLRVWEAHALLFCPPRGGGDAFSSVPP